MTSLLVMEFIGFQDQEAHPGAPQSKEIRDWTNSQRNTRHHSFLTEAPHKKPSHWPLSLCSFLSRACLFDPSVITEEEEKAVANSKDASHRSFLLDHKGMNP